MLVPHVHVLSIIQFNLTWRVPVIPGLQISVISGCQPVTYTAVYYNHMTPGNAFLLYNSLYSSEQDTEFQHTKL